MAKERADVLCVNQGLFESREKAKRAIMAGIVFNDNIRIDKAGEKVESTAELRIKGKQMPYVSRGGLKLEKAMKNFDLSLEGKVCMDIGASTGGFTDCMLQNGATKVYSVDVGYGQLAWKLQSDPRVEVHDRTNVRTLDPASVAPAPELVVGDMSFISLTLVLPALVAAAAPHADFLLMVKPQFEIGKERLGHGGVVRNPVHHVETVETVARCAIDLGLDIAAIAASPLPGPSGNVEYFVHMRRDYPDPIDPTQLTDYIRRAVEAGPAGGSR